MIGDERDLIRLRSNYREDDVYMYPIRTTPAGRKALFLDVMRRAQKLASDPEYYHTIFHTCTTVIQDHANAVLEDKKVRWSKDILLPKYSDTVAYDLGLIDTRLSLEEAREYYLINGRARQANQSEEFSELIRPEIR